MADLGMGEQSLQPTRDEAAIDRRDDPAIAAWKAWHMAHRRALVLCRKQQRLESELVRTVGFPHVMLSVPGVLKRVRIGSLQEFDALAERYPSIRQLRGRVASDLRANRLRWDAADRKLGYSAALRQEASAAAKEHQLERFSIRLHRIRLLRSSLRLRLG